MTYCPHFLHIGSNKIIYAHWSEYNFSKVPIDTRHKYVVHYAAWCDMNKCGRNQVWLGDSVRWDERRIPAFRHITRTNRPLSNTKSMICVILMVHYLTRSKQFNQHHTPSQAKIKYDPILYALPSTAPPIFYPYLYYWFFMNALIYHNKIKCISIVYSVI